MKNSVTLEEAIEIAKKRNPNINACQEYEDAFEFFIDDDIERAGGSDVGFVVEKENGTVLRWAEYFLNPEKEIKKVNEPVKLKG